MNARLNQIEQKILKKERISAQEGLVLFNNADLLTLGFLSNFVRTALHPHRRVTYIIDRNINYTNICVAQCDFCAFYKKVGSPEGYVLKKDQIARKIEETIALGGTQILMQGGLNPALKIEFFEDLFRFIRNQYPTIRIHSLSPAEITYVAKISRLTLEQTLIRLKEAGLASIPGGGAEILVDEVRRKLNANKTTTSQWLEVMETAHHLGMKTTATMMFGHIETLEDRIEHLVRIRNLQDKTGGFTAFIPWTYQPNNTKLGGEKASAFDYLRTLAISRLMLDNVPNIQVSWVTMGAKIAQVGLQFGGNDFGSLMIEENVVAAAGAGFRLSLDEIKRQITDAGYEPHQRDMEYNLLN
ncbi:MAG: dehypoxanthine futalosine cyclase [Calditrichaceae bacterium]|nr:dehypoxanthine futalosine cyclase [Calditrichaceae bacterium]RQV94239.1 MAG: dehypoxanthine futalosine cyclase [Calditrichota bacterium]